MKKNCIGLSPGNRVVVEHFNFPEPFICTILEGMEGKSSILMKSSQSVSKSVQAGDAIVLYNGYPSDFALLGDVIYVVAPDRLELLTSSLEVFSDLRHTHPARYPISLAAGILDYGSQMYGFAVAKDISWTGIRLNSSNTNYSTGQEIDINLSIELHPEEKDINFSGVIANKKHIQHFCDYGISISSMDSKDQEMFDHLMRCLAKKFAF